MDYMDKVKNIERKFCLIIGVTFLILSLVTHISCFTFGFMSGICLAGWMLLPYKEREIVDDE